jgi:serpin B
MDIANAIWMQNSGNILRSFVSNVTNYYDADIYAHDFTSSDAGRTINRWCSDKTDGMIDRLFEDGSLPYSLLFTNALYFKSDWRNKFDKKLTVKDKFTNSDKSKSDVEMMRWKDLLYLNYANLENMNVVSIPYKGNFSMAVALPDEGVDISECISAFNSENWEKILEGFKTNTKEYKFDVVFPKFDISSDFYLIGSLMSQGIVSVFGDEADLSRISSDNKSIGVVRQVTRLKVNEDGAEAAAVTVGGDVSANPHWGEKVEFRLDRPFILAIYDNTTNAILFLGSINKL